MPPLSGLEVLGQGKDPDGTLVYRMGLNINLRSTTIEPVMAVRKQQVRAPRGHRDGSSLVGCMAAVWRLYGGCVVVLKIGPGAGARADGAQGHRLPAGLAAGGSVIKY
jgi:hypothetical protein